MRSPRPQTLLAGILTTVVTCAALTAATSSPAHAFNWGQLWANGSGALYARADVINMGVVPGGAARSWTYKVVNPGPTAQRFQVRLDEVDPALTAGLYVGGSPVATPYTTPVLAPGASRVVTVKMALAPRLPQGQYAARITLIEPESGWELAETRAVADATYERGHTSHDLFIKTGGQPYAGGSAPQYETASTLGTGTSVTFSLRLQNNGAAPARMALALTQGGAAFCPGDLTVTVRQGVTDVTRAVRTGTYEVLLAPGARRVLTMTVKETSASPCVPEDYLPVRATGPDGQVDQYPHVIIAE